MKLLAWTNKGTSLTHIHILSRNLFAVRSVLLSPFPVILPLPLDFSLVDNDEK